MKPIKYLFILLSIILFSCRKEVNEKLTATDTQLVVNSFISPNDDSIRIKLDYTNNYFKESNNRVELLNNLRLASVTINDGVSDKRLIWSPRNRHFHISKNNLPILANRKYILKIITSDGKTATAETTVPSPITDFDLIIASTYTQSGDKYNRFRMSLQDEKGINNYYRFVFYEQLKYTNTSIALDDQFSEIELEFFTDNNDQSREIFLLSDLRVQNRFNSGGPQVEFFVRGYFEKGDEAYYKYLNTVKLNSEASENPFAEPTTVYTNITGGLGVFSSYQRVEKSIRNN